VAGNCQEGAKSLTLTGEHGQKEEIEEIDGRYAKPAQYVLRSDGEAFLLHWYYDTVFPSSDGPEIGGITETAAVPIYPGWARCIINNFRDRIVVGKMIETVSLPKSLNTRSSLAGGNTELEARKITDSGEKGGCGDQSKGTVVHMTRRETGNERRLRCRRRAEQVEKGKEGCRILDGSRFTVKMSMA
jgi:hypothetical protein